MSTLPVHTVYIGSAAISYELFSDDDGSSGRVTVCDQRGEDFSFYRYYSSEDETQLGMERTVFKYVLSNEGQ